MGMCKRMQPDLAINQHAKAGPAACSLHARNLVYEHHTDCGYRKIDRVELN